MLDGHGDDLHLVGTPIEHNFSSNVYYKGCPAALHHHVQSQVSRIENYPSPAANELNAWAAQHVGLSAEQVLFTNGATEAFYLLAQAFAGKSATIVGPTFAEYEDACRSHGINYTFIRREDLSTAVLTTELLFLCNPNNPDGGVISLAQVQRLAIRYPTTCLIIDEAYLEFTQSTSSAVSLLADFANLVVVRSLTKTFCIPGLRLGYLLASPDRIQSLLAYKMPWTVNALAIAAGIYIFQHYQALRFDVPSLLNEARSFAAAIQELAGFEVVPSHTSYFLVRLLRGTATDLKAFLLKKGILIRDATNFTTLRGEYIRVAVQSPVANQALINALRTWT